MISARNDTPDKPRKTKPPGPRSLGFVAVYFNPCGYKALRDNFQCFVEKFAWLGDRLLVVELVYGDKKPYFVGRTDNVVVEHTDSIMWHKENLINIGTGHLRRKGFENVGWLDGDIQIISPRSMEGWYDSIVVALRTLNAVQVFDKIEHSFSDRVYRNLSAMGTHEWTNTNPLRITKNGGGWAVRGDIWDQCKWFDLGVTGAGDQWVFLASIGQHDKVEELPPFKNPSRVYLKHYLRWADRWCKRIDGKVGCVEATMTTDPHGTQANRQYGPRGQILCDEDFDPDRDTCRAPNGLLGWSDEASDILKTKIKSFFEGRQEDGI